MRSSSSDFLSAFACEGASGPPPPTSGSSPGREPVCGRHVSHPEAPVRLTAAQDSYVPVGVIFQMAPVFGGTSYGVPSLAGLIRAIP
jgi:hypothetical protein